MKVYGFFVYLAIISCLGFGIWLIISGFTAKLKWYYKIGIVATGIICILAAYFLSEHLIIQVTK